MTQIDTLRFTHTHTKDIFLFVVDLLLLLLLFDRNIPYGLEVFQMHFLVPQPIQYFILYMNSVTKLFFN